MSVESIDEAIADAKNAGTDGHINPVFGVYKFLDDLAAYVAQSETLYTEVKELKRQREGFQRDIKMLEKQVSMLSETAEYWRATAGELKGKQP